MISSFLIPYVGFFLYAINEYDKNAYNLSPPNPETFLEANSSVLYSMAMWFEENIVKYHLPHDLIVNTVFNSSEEGGEVIGYTNVDHASEWTGIYLMTEAHKYIVQANDGNVTLANITLQNIIKALRGIDMILHVSGNGAMARYAWPITEYPADPYNRPSEYHYLGNWNGTAYVFVGDTSRDMYNGVIMGLGFTYLLIENDEIRNYTKNLIEDILDYFLLNGWQYISPEGDPNAAELDVGFWLFGTPGLWTLGYLKIGALVNPQKYGPLYDNYAIERDYVHRAVLPSKFRAHVIQSYFALLLEWEILFILILLEHNPFLRNIYLDYVSVIYNFTKYDRNALLNSMWLIINGVNLENCTPAEELVINDIDDCLMRYYNTTQRFPGRAITITNDEVVDPISIKWTDFFEEGWGGILYPFWEDVFHFEIVSKYPLTPDLRPQTDFLWSCPPYWFEQQADGTVEGVGLDFTVVYWLCRYYNIIESPLNYNLTIEVNYGGV